jgi:hypothetical protein
MRHIEHNEQCNLMQWWSFACRSFGVPETLLFAIPNGGARDLITGALLKREGVRAGVPDLFLAIPKGGQGGLFLELKKPKGGRVSEAQKGMLSTLQESGYSVAVCHGWTAAKEAIENYLKGEKCG